jgi:hypothetical protein
VAARRANLSCLMKYVNVWFGHSPWQVRAWLAEALDAGLVLIPPFEGSRRVGQADTLLRRHPGAVCAVADDVVRLRGGASVRIASGADADPVCAAAVVYALWRAGLTQAGEVTLRTGADRITPTLAEHQAD